MKVLVVAGARPNFMKVAPIIAALKERGHESILVHTGQHYDAEMSGAFFRDLGIPDPDHHLSVGSGTHAQQTARIMEAFEPVLIATKPDWLLVVGDVNSTIATALVASKLREQLGCRIVHVEAGLRSNDWRMPEEVNRVLTDRLSDLLLTPSADALPNLLTEGIPADRIEFVGNVMIDTLMMHLDEARARKIPGRFGLNAGEYVLATLHRPSNVDSAEVVAPILEALARVSKKLPVVLPIHPRTRRSVAAFGLDALLSDLHVVDPLGYVDMLGLTDGSAVVLTDSGGLQEETTALGVPCVTLREQTERPITVEQGTNKLAPWPLTADGVFDSFDDALRRGRVAVGARSPEGWDGRTAMRIVDALARRT
jgi:UDP-N-acetylglucosamine 2-epimerase (non-hydrolysing)